MALKAVNAYRPGRFLLTIWPVARPKVHKGYKKAIGGGRSQGPTLRRKPAVGPVGDGAGRGAGIAGHWRTSQRETATHLRGTIGIEHGPVGFP
jgi:hypothetical protein